MYRFDVGRSRLSVVEDSIPGVGGGLLSNAGGTIRQHILCIYDAYHVYYSYFTPQCSWYLLSGPCRVSRQISYMFGQQRARGIHRHHFRRGRSCEGILNHYLFHNGNREECTCQRSFPKWQKRHLNFTWHSSGRCHNLRKKTFVECCGPPGRPVPVHFLHCLEETNPLCLRR